MPEPAPAPSQTLQQLWQRFLEQPESIMVHKWLESQKAAHDIGIERAIRESLTLISL
ncbi:MAG: hypothetical protein NTW03_20100 [Verrucomicrobia bacterium]|nr:hypothetical protein [Verrucomicrobiota bacterium]